MKTNGKNYTPPLTPQILLKAYSIGLFPMAESADDPNLFWVEPEIRGTLPLDEFHAPRSLAKKIRKKPYTITVNRAFKAVVRGCADPAPDRADTWINATIMALYAQLFEMGHAHSVEAWDHDAHLVGGLYGVSLGRAFFGESMFSRATDASKICLVHLVERMKARGFVLLDTQFSTDHLRQFGVIDVPRDDYMKMLEEALIGDAEFAD